jgi:hypothetical protein
MKESVTKIDMYILEQILKDSFKTGGKVLDEECVNRRN